MNEEIKGAQVKELPDERGIAMSVKRYQTLYPDNIFRAQIDFKNVASSEDKWAEGPLCRDDAGNFMIINCKNGEDAYAFNGIFLDTLGLCSDFYDGDKKGIFEGDIIRISRFSDNIAPAEEPAEESEEEMPEEHFDEFVEEDFSKESGGDDEIRERKVYSEVPDGCETLFTVSGVVFLSEGIFYIQFLDAETGYLSALPLYVYFGFDMLPGYCTAVKVIGNMYDDEELYAQTLGLSEGGMLQQ